MYVRVKATPNSPRKSVQIVASVRSGNKVSQKIVRYVGIAMDDDELERLKELGRHIIAKIEVEHQPSLFSAEEAVTMSRQVEDAEDKNQALLVDLKKLEEQQRCIVGIHDILGKAYDDLGFNQVLGVRSPIQKEILKHTVLARCANPGSKRATRNLLSRDFGINLPLKRIYKMMDALNDKAIKRMQDSAYEVTKSLLGGKVKVLFYDCTTLYFESFAEKGLMQNGYSKDMKFNQPQVLLALFVTDAGLPVGYELFPGDKYEGHTLVEVLKKLKLKFELEQVVFVADRGLLSDDNLLLLEREGFEYIVGARVKNLPKKQQAVVLNKEAYQKISEQEKICELTYKERRLIASYHVDRASKDAHDREKAIERLKAKLNKSKKPESLINNFGYKKYMKVTGESKVSVDEQKSIEAEKWDGIAGVFSNTKDLSVTEILGHYRSLWQIEESFRISKHDLRVRPIYHWTDKRIKAHIAIVFMSYCAIRYLQYRVKLQYEALSPEVLVRELNHVQKSLLIHTETEERYSIPSKLSPTAKKLYKIMEVDYPEKPCRIR